VAGRKILVIDDSKVIRVRVREMLPPGNFDVLEAKDGKQGLDLIHQEKPNLIMLDFLLPKLSGWDVFQQIQASDELRKIPLVLMSGRKEEVTEKIPEPFEYFEFIEKPFEKQHLIGAIKSAFQKASLPRPTAAAKADKPQPVPEAPALAATAEVEALKQQMAKMQAEINQLKKYVAQFNVLKKQLAQLKAIVVKQRKS
jgi:CheY-like chemotaxis protein